MHVHDEKLKREATHYKPYYQLVPLSIADENVLYCQQPVDVPSKL